jgi:hypothetical protein
MPGVSRLDSITARLLGGRAVDGWENTQEHPRSHVAMYSCGLSTPEHPRTTRMAQDT